MNYWCITFYICIPVVWYFLWFILASLPMSSKILRKHRWPGNLRELSNLMEYLVNVVPSGEVIDSTLLPPNLLNNGTTEQSDVTEVSEAHLSLDDAGGTALEEMEKQMIREALSRHTQEASC